MSVNNRFEAYKLKRELMRSGKEYVFKRPIVDKFNQVSDEFEEDVIKITGLYHEQSGYINLVTSEGSVTRVKKVPMILCLYSDLGDLKKNDQVMINGKAHKVTGIANVQEWSIIADISMEVVDVI